MPTQTGSAKYKVISSSEAEVEDEETFIEIEPVQTQHITGTRQLPDSNADSVGEFIRTS